MRSADDNAHIGTDFYGKGFLELLIISILYRICRWGYSWMFSFGMFYMAVLLLLNLILIGYYIKPECLEKVFRKIL